MLYTLEQKSDIFANSALYFFFLLLFLEFEHLNQLHFDHRA